MPIRRRTGQIGRDPGGERGGQRESRRAAQEDIVDHGQRARPLAQEREARIDHCGADEQRESEHGTQDADHDGRVDRNARGKRREHGLPVDEMRGAEEEHDTYEGRQHDDLARQPRRAPLRGRTPCPLGTAEVEEGRDEPRGEKRERDQTSLRIKRMPVLRRQHAEQRVDLHSEERQEQSLAGADQRREQQYGKVRPHDLPSRLPGHHVVERQAPTLPAWATGRRPSADCRSRTSSSSWMCIGVLRLGR